MESPGRVSTGVENSILSLLNETIKFIQFEIQNDIFFDIFYGRILKVGKIRYYQL